MPPSRRHPLFARSYAAWSAAEEAEQAPHRVALLEGLAGRVLEVGCGNGLNFTHYPATVTELVAVEPEPFLRRRAAARAAEALPGRQVTVVDGSAGDLPPAADGPFDAVVFSLVLCSVPDVDAALEAAAARLGSGGELRAYEHVAGAGALARRQRLLAPLWALTAGGCRPDRDTLAAVERRFRVGHLERFDFCAGPRWLNGLVAPRILVRARPAVRVHGGRAG